MSMIMDDMKYDACIDCNTYWEALPDDHEPIPDEPFFPFSKMCDNCAFRKGSLERKDKDAWNAMMIRLAYGGRFYCHKGVPIKPESEHGFDYPKKNGTHDIEKMRPCRGYLDMIVKKQMEKSKEAKLVSPNITEIYDQE